MGILFLALYVLFSGGQLMMNKFYQIRQRKTTAAYLLYLLVIGIISIPLYFLLSGCDTTVDGKLFGYSIVTALVIGLKMVVTLVSMSYSNISELTITQNAGTLVIPSLYGFLFLKENITFLRVLAIMFMMIAFLITFSHDRSADIKPKKNSIQGQALCVVLFFLSGAVNVASKAFTISGSKASNEAFLTWINIFMVILVTLVFFLTKKNSKQPMREFTSGIQAKNYVLVCIGSIFNGIGMVCSMEAMMWMDMAIYSPMYSAMYMVLLLLISRMVFKEKISLQNILSAALGVASVVCTVLG